MTDVWETVGGSIDAPAKNAAAVTPNDSADLSNVAVALYVGGSGDVSVDTVGGQESVVFSGVSAGTVLPVRVKRVNSTSTTATDIVALW